MAAGWSGDIAPELTNVIKDNNFVAAAVLSGNRNFEARVHPLTAANYLASPPLVVAYAIAGSMNVDLAKEPLGVDQKGKKVFLRDIWPTNKEIDDFVRKNITKHGLPTFTKFLSDLQMSGTPDELVEQPPEERVQTGRPRVDRSPRDQGGRITAAAFGRRFTGWRSRGRCSG